MAVIELFNPIFTLALKGYRFIFSIVHRSLITNLQSCTVCAYHPKFNDRISCVSMPLDGNCIHLKPIQYFHMISNLVTKFRIDFVGGKKPVVSIASYLQLSSKHMGTNCSILRLCCQLEFKMSLKLLTPL